MFNVNKIFGVILLNILLVACANYTPENQYSSQGNIKTDNLVVPPNLDEPDTNTDYKSINIQNAKNSYLISNIHDMKIQQGGSQRWLVLYNKNVEQIWPIMLEFLNHEGLTIKLQNKGVGFIQTDWATRNNTVPQTAVRGFFSWIGWGEMYSMPTQYMFRITLWQNESNTQIFVTDIQMSEVYPNCNPSLNSSIETSDKQVTRWMAFPPNPQLELEFLIQFMAFATAKPDDLQQIKQTIALESQVTNKNASIENGQIVVNDNFDRVWWRVGLALDRIGLGVADKNRTQGEYLVYTLKSQVNIPEPGFFTKLFGSGKGTNLQLPEAQYKVQINASSNTQTVITITPIKKSKKLTKDLSIYINDLYNQLK